MHHSRLSKSRSKIAPPSDDSGCSAGSTWMDLLKSGWNGSGFGVGSGFIGCIWGKPWITLTPNNGKDFRRVISYRCE